MMISFQYLPLYSTAVLNGAFWTPSSALRSGVAKTEVDGDNKTKGRTRSVQCFQARVHVQSPTAAPVSLPQWPCWPTSRGAAVSTEQRRKLPNPWHKSRCRAQQLGNRHRRKALAIFKWSMKMSCDLWMLANYKVKISSGKPGTEDWEWIHSYVASASCPLQSQGDIHLGF